MTKDEIHNLLDTTIANKAIESVNEGVTIADMQQKDQPLIYVNPAFEKITGYTAAEVLGTNCRFLQRHLSDQPAVALIREAIKSNKNLQVMLKNYKKDGEFFWNYLSMAPILDNNGKLLYYVGIQKDITNEVLQRERILYLTEHDDLTGLLNFRGFFSRIKPFLQQAQSQDCCLGIGIIDINFFKKINDTYGHLRGNTILKTLGGELLHSFSPEDLLARFGGDEFCFALKLTSNDSKSFYNHIKKVEDKVNFALSRPLKISLSAGIVIVPAFVGTKIDHLINLADEIMYKNKEAHHKKEAAKHKI